MKSDSSEVNQVPKLWSKDTVRTSCFGLMCFVGIYCWWASECSCWLLTALSSVFVFGYIACSYFSPEIRSRSSEDTEVILVTGCDTGLGYSLALHLNSIGLRVIAGVHRKESPGALQLSAISRIFVHPVDITCCDSVKNFNKAVYDYVERNGLVLRALVNNAGAMIFGEFEWQTEDQMRHQIEVNLIGTMRLTREFLPMIRGHSTRIITVTSHCSSESLPGVSIYAATKAALSAWSTALRVELKKYAVDVVMFVPGSFIRESNLLSQQRGHFDAMESAMSKETRCFYGHYFTRYANYLSNLAPTDLPQKLMNPKVYEVFEGALFDQHPRAVYKCEPWRYTVYHTLFKITPTALRDRLVERFMMLPSWQDSDCVKSPE